MKVREFGTPYNLTASGYAGGDKVAGQLLGFYVNSSSAGTIVLKNGGASGTAVSGTITPTIGWHTYAVYFSKDCHVTISGTIDVTFSFAPG